MEDPIDTKIKNANLESEYNVFSGQCLSIAVALNEYFDTTLLLVSELPEEGFDHAVIETDGKIYDGSGRVGWAETVNNFVHPAARNEDIESHFRQVDNPKSEFPAAFDEQVYNSVLHILQAN